MTTTTGKRWPCGCHLADRGYSVALCPAHAANLKALFERPTPEPNRDTFAVQLSLARMAIGLCGRHKDDTGVPGLVWQVERLAARYRDLGDVDRADKLLRLVEWFKAGAIPDGIGAVWSEQERPPVFVPGLAYPIETLPDDLLDDKVPPAAKWALRRALFWNSCQGWWHEQVADFWLGNRYRDEPIALFWSPEPAAPMTREEILAARKQEEDGA